MHKLQGYDKRQTVLHKINKATDWTVPAFAAQRDRRTRVRRK